MAKVLVIEDDPIILENTLELLELEGFNAIGAEDGSIGVQRAREAIPDLIICDLAMPNLDGFGVLQTIRADPQMHAIPLIFVSASPREDIVAASTKLGVSDYLLKPFRANDLLRVVEKHLGS
ncbi:MAG TPA: response regulator [Phototrophicaceae bacterium]|nr:response regulator [Phototrophicaceae bacterium]